ncbi:phosphate ABC transporter permease subunit PstC [Brachybacterium muris]|uniref:Phosphate transport system permease protein n=3 Tax=Brachybacterium TaxID=43668 RepID=A0A022L0M6_9MICO|nr:phosphate ABC transporter permease subunit PstC [Brachybacterium muris]PZP17731.1 MAG: phosphate ABC transporter permease subunit PstC [Brachybacterium faecium]EYT50927.1 phosphate ABC transporter permease [Brachybacterium muris UCD-AY4]MCT1431710.1 phosphate ABC transporter permease subunit PstC [Brachybacterium muris]MCT1654440.1 phosphate ABC transporter permease subunit PstC [Brachybacterium muris]MCT1997972.1 phosphate ABC transporter permease subunit PstC [Brachybacterium muris]
MSTTEVAPETPDAPPTSMKRSGGRFGDSLFSNLSIGSGLLIFLTLAAVAIFLTLEAWPAIQASQEFTGTAEFSLIEYTAPLIFGTVLAAALALVIAIPISMLIALFISHYAPRKMAQGLGYMIDLLAAVPSVVYGLWGGIWLVPKLEPLYVFLNNTFGDPDRGLGRWLQWPDFMPWVGGEPIIGLLAGEPTAPMRNLASASVVLAVMVLPIITAIAREVFLQTPRLTEEAALALGATRWEVIKTVVLPFGRSGVVAASMLGLGRALGETMAVLMILAPGFTFSWHILEVGRHQSIAANIASRQAEASGVDMSLLIFTGLVLFVLTFIINAIARAIVARSGPKS